MNTAPGAARAADQARPLTTQEAQEKMAALLGPPPPAPEPAPATRAACEALRTAEAALRADEAESAAVERAYAAAVERSDVRAMQQLADRRTDRQGDQAALRIAVAKAEAEAYNLQAQDAQAAVEPLRPWVQRAMDIATEQRALALQAELQAQQAVGRIQQQGQAVDALQQRWSQAQRAVRAMTARLSEQLGTPGVPPTERSRLL